MIHERSDFCLVFLCRLDLKNPLFRGKIGANEFIVSEVLEVAFGDNGKRKKTPLK